MTKTKTDSNWKRLSHHKTLPMPVSAGLLSGRLLDLDRADPEGVNHAAAVTVYGALVACICLIPILIASGAIGSNFVALFLITIMILIFGMLVLKPSRMVKSMSKGWLDKIRPDIDRLLAPYLVEDEKILATLNMADPSKGHWNAGYCIATTHRCIMLKARTFLHPIVMAKLVPGFYDFQVVDIAHPDHFKPGFRMQPRSVMGYSAGVSIRPLGCKAGKVYSLGPNEGNNYSVFVEITVIRREIYGSVLNL